MLRKFGIEIEMNYVNGRRGMADELATIFGNGAPYVQGSKYGYPIIRVQDNKDREWCVEYDGSINGRTDEKAELVTPPLTIEDLPLLAEVLRHLRATGAKAGAENGCGMHVHVDTEGIRDNLPKLQNLLHLWEIFEDDFLQVAGTKPARLNQWCAKTATAAARAKKAKSMTEISQIFSSRYMALNLRPLWDKPDGARTIEFRFFETCIAAPEKIEVYVMMILTLVESAITMKRVPRRENRLTDEYAFLNYLWRYGLKGSEYAHIRKYISNRLRKPGTNLSPRGRSTYPN